MKDERSGRVAGVIPKEELVDAFLLRYEDIVELEEDFKSDSLYLWCELNYHGRNCRGAEFDIDYRGLGERGRQALMCLDSKGWCKVRGGDDYRYGKLHIRILRGPYSHGSGKTRILTQRTEEFVSEECLTRLFKGLFNIFMPPGFTLAEPPMTKPNLFPDVWVETPDKELVPVEAKKFDFDDAAMRQLADYMIEYRCRRGIALATSLTTRLPGNVMFVRYDTKANHMYIDKPWAEAENKETINLLWAPEVPEPKVSRPF